MSRLKASTTIEPGRIDVHFTVLREEWPVLRFVRRRFAYPADQYDGLSLCDTDLFFQAPRNAWALSIKERFLVDNSKEEGGLVQVELVRCYATVPANVTDAPNFVRLRYHDTAERELTLTPVHTETTVDPGTGQVEQWRFFDAPLPSDPALVLSISESQVVVAPRGETQHTADFTVHQSRFSAAREEEATPSHFEVSFTEWGSFDEALVNSDRSVPASFGRALLSERFDEVNGTWERAVHLEDRAPSIPADENHLVGEQYYYYRVFERPPSGSPTTDPAWRALALATSSYGFGRWPETSPLAAAFQPEIEQESSISDLNDPEPPPLERNPARRHRFYDLLPVAHQELDEPRASDRGNGQLRRLTEVFGAVLDHVRGSAEALRALHEVDSVRTDGLPRLARYLGWDLDLTNDELTQRLDIRFAPKVFGSVGTTVNLRALVNRASGEQVAIKEFVDNVCFTNHERAPTAWRVHHQQQDLAGDWSSPSALSDGKTYLASPSVVAREAGGNWYFWQRFVDDDQGAGSWHIESTPPSGVPQTLPHGANELLGDHSEHDPYALRVVHDSIEEVWLFSIVRPRQSWQWAEVLLRRFDATTELQLGSEVLLTTGAQHNSSPTAAARNDEVWLFWQRGTSDSSNIWCRVRRGDAWDELPTRVTSGTERDESPNAAVDALGRIWLFWTRKEGAHSRIWYRRFDGVSWGAETVLSSGERHEEAPSAQWFDGRLTVFWHADQRAGTSTSGPTPLRRPKQLWRTSFDGTEFAPPELVPGPAGDSREPSTTLRPDGTLELIWRSTPPDVKSQARTLDTSDAQVLAALGTFDDTAHYTYDTKTGNGNWFAGNAVGLFFRPTEGDPATFSQHLRRLQSFVEPFRPANVRFVWHAPLNEGTRTEQLGRIEDSFEDFLVSWLHTWSGTGPGGETVDASGPEPELRYRTYQKTWGSP